MNSHIIIITCLGVPSLTGPCTILLDVWFTLCYVELIYTIINILQTYSHVCTYTFLLCVLNKDEPINHIVLSTFLHFQTPQTHLSNDSIMTLSQNQNDRFLENRK